MMLTMNQVKNKSTPHLLNLHPVVLIAATLLIERCYKRGVPILITQGLRTMTDQDALYAQGRTKTGSIVTNARGGYSYHNYGLAIDFALLLPDGKSVSWDMCRDGNGDLYADWQEVVREGKAVGLEWGGDWTRFKDYSHFQLTFGLTITQLRAGFRPSASAVEAANRIINQKEEDPEVEKEVIAIVKINGVKIVDGFLDNGITYVPVRILAEALGAQVGYDSTTKTVEITARAK
ncbi:M15 family metallopeptidase [Paenibacillus sp. 19GGS1-52]|uniref:M15 family metallopeptidase n=1 Tax=Paenibacillus sp. 19GGS1-52 TaxID=2758563 RepID=UPI001EFB684D|nr:M15 family metallopeptidase [Paenibacillus sp. 19GGS1-52]ULO08152.1 M15 family metallopeptidase [Paenibacillus sp. 19GGS1-52]